MDIDELLRAAADYQYHRDRGDAEYEDEARRRFEAAINRIIDERIRGAIWGGMESVMAKPHPTSNQPDH